MFADEVDSYQYNLDHYEEKDNVKHFSDRLIASIGIINFKAEVEGTENEHFYEHNPSVP